MSILLIQRKLILSTLSTTFIRTISKFSTKQEFDKYCLDLVKSRDYDHYLIGLLLSTKYQGPYFALRSFNAEIATIKDYTKGNAAAGRIRFQYWQKSLDQIFQPKDTTTGKTSSTTSSSSVSNFDQSSDLQPIAKALLHYKETCNWSSGLFYRYLEARYRHCYNYEYEKLSDLEDMTENTHSSILYLTLEMMNIKSNDMDQMASHIGVSSGIVTFIKALTIPESQEHTSFPLEISLKYGLNSNILLGKFMTMEEKKKLQDAIYDIASQAAGHLDCARALYKTCSSSNIHALPISLDAVSTSLYLEQLRRCDFDIFSPTLLPEQLRLRQTIRLYKTRVFGSF